MDYLLLVFSLFNFVLIIYNFILLINLRKKVTSNLLKSDKNNQLDLIIKDIKDLEGFRENVRISFSNEINPFIRKYSRVLEHLAKVYKENA